MKTLYKVQFSKKNLHNLVSFLLGDSARAWISIKPGDVTAMQLAGARTCSSVIKVP